MDSQEPIFGNFDNEGSDDSSVDYSDPEDSELVRDAKKIIVDPLEYEFDHQRVILYNIGIGATEKQVSLDTDRYRCDKWICVPVEMGIRGRQ